MSEVVALVDRIVGSVGEAVFEDITGLALPPEPRETWIELQSDVLEIARRSTPIERVHLADALLGAILDQPSYGPSNRLEHEAFDFLLETLGDDLSRALDQRSGHQYGGARYLHEHLWTVPGEAGAIWLRRLALADDIRADFLYQGMRVPGAPRWRDADWPGRLDAVASLPAHPRPGIVRVLPSVDAPRDASPALTRVALVHGVNESDHLVRGVSRRIRELRDHDSARDVDLFDWSAGRLSPELFRWILELSGDEGERGALVAAAERLGLVTPDEAAALAEPLDRPTWADGPVRWTVDRVECVGSVALPSGRLSGGDPWRTGGPEGLPWVVEVGADRVTVDVVIADHPLSGQQCGALLATVDAGAVHRWELVDADGDPGYTVEVGVAGFGSPEAYDEYLVEDPEAEAIFADPPRWQVIDAPTVGGIAMCTVGPQHELCRTWVGLTDAGVVIRLVTDLGLLQIDPASEATLPW